MEILLLRSSLSKLPRGRVTFLKHLGLFARRYHERRCSNLYTNGILGIDIGTRSARVAIMTEEEVPRICLTESGRKVPSYVAVSENNEILVGRRAKIHALKYPQDAFFNIKNLIGRTYDDPYIQNLMKTVPYKIVEGVNGELLVEARGRRFTALEILSFLFEHLRKLAELNVNNSVRRSVISVPYHFNSKQRSEIDAAGKKAGLSRTLTINEPVAAALSSKTIKNGVVVVCCLGSESFGFSVLEIDNNNIRIKAANDEFDLGGENFDRQIFNYILKEVKESCDFGLSMEKLVMSRIHVAATRVKNVLSHTHSTILNLKQISRLANDRMDTLLWELPMEITRAKLEQLVRPLVEDAKMKCMNTLNEAGISVEQVDELILAGGMARMPLLQQTFAGMFNKTPSMWGNPDEAIAAGASIQAALVSEEDEWDFCERAPLSFGVETIGGLFEPIIKRKSALPAKVQRKISTSSDFQDGIGIRVFMGDREKASDNKFLGEINLSGLPPLPLGCLNHVLTFELSKAKKHVESHFGYDLPVGLNLTVSVWSEIAPLISKTFHVPDFLHRHQVLNLIIESVIDRSRSFKECYFMQVKEMARAMIEKTTVILETKEYLNGKCSAYVKMKQAFDELKEAVDSGEHFLLEDKIRNVDMHGKALLFREEINELESEPETYDDLSDSW